MHFVNAKSILSAQNGMNLYRGCSHGCIYCDSRSKCYHIEHDFEDIEIKENAIELLENALRRKRKKCMLGTGSMTDPYIPLESKIGNVRKALALANKYGFGFTLITKSDRVLRDLDLLKSINDKTKCVVQMTLTTYDEDLCKKIEPNVSTTKERFEALKKLNEAGIPTIVWLCPILPFINDTEENIRGILEYCIEAKVYGVICFGNAIWRNVPMTTKISNNENAESGLLPYPVIIAATKGDPEAMNIVVQHYESYIASLSMRKLRDERGNTYWGIDEDIRDRLRSRLMRAVLSFKV